MENKTYYPHLDLLKGLAILLMVMGHVLPWTIDSDIFHKPFMDLEGNELQLTLVYKIIYSFHMPLLFFVSGFLFYKPINHDKQYLKNILVKRTKRILIPYLATGSLLMICRDHWGYWFLQCLFFMDLLVAFAFFSIDHFKIRFKVEILLFALIGLFLFILGKLCANLEDNTNGIIVIGRLFNYYPAFILGTLVHKYEKLRSLLHNEYIILCCLVIFICAFILSGYRIHVIGLFVNIILPISIIIYLNHLFIKDCNVGGGKKILSLIGKNSMEIYILHVFFVLVVKEVGDFMMTLDSFVSVITFQIVYSFLVSLVAIVLSILTANFLKGSKLLKSLLFGL